ncbi:MAG: bifunctional phosphopantothenoylcysteine decarboxylase/phosphopantothenate--cysteine ligase CoaBC [Chloroflexi bacterium]|nr:bifunctional phosphopantothenoylcysteine decarboxylase/phosphopantothenate--cysteine ligase CoaBC [Chloroflexota bacterium]
MSAAPGDDAVAPPRPLAGRRIVLGVTGSIAAYRAFEIARRLQEAGATVDVALTPNASRFAPAFTFRNLVGGVVSDDLWTTAEDPELHVALGRRADALLVAPASATTIAKLAQGIGDNLPTLTALATRAPVAVAPAMDSVMFAHPAVQANLETLKARGVMIVGPERGRLASGQVGLGRLSEPADVVGATRALLGRHDGALRGRHVLVTAGGTREAIDPVRYVGNRSSGRMGFALAEAARDRGAAVTLVGTQAPPPGLYGVIVERVESAEEMRTAVARRREGIDALIMAAAVADYRPAEPAAEKIKKAGQGGAPTLELEQTTDIVAEASGRFVKVGFAAETEDLLANAAKKLAAKGLDLIVANDVGAEGSGFGSETNQVTLLAPGEEPAALPLLHKYDVACAVLDRVAAGIEARAR